MFTLHRICTLKCLHIIAIDFFLRYESIVVSISWIGSNGGGRWVGSAIESGDIKDAEYQKMVPVLN